MWIFWSSGLNLLALSFLSQFFPTLLGKCHWLSSLMWWCNLRRHQDRNLFDAIFIKILSPKNDTLIHILFIQRASINCGTFHNEDFRMLFWDRQLDLLWLWRLRLLSKSTICDYSVFPPLGWIAFEVLWGFTGAMLAFFCLIVFAFSGNLLDWGRTYYEILGVYYLLVTGCLVEEF
jgi:hypothetical protein